MFHKPKKRKYRTHGDREYQSSGEHSQTDPVLFIQAHEADLVRGPTAADAARSLEVVQGKPEGVEGKMLVGNALIRWARRGGFDVNDLTDTNDDVFQLGRASIQHTHPSKEVDEIWVDRYDARLLLQSLPTAPPSPRSPGEPVSPGGWSDLPSDAEDTFFFSPDEAEDYRREKRRRVIDRDREARLQALRADDSDDEVADPRADWGGSDEEPDEAQTELMRRTAAHVLSSPNPAQLEMRILTNHGTDPRFAFLRGRWARAWRLAKGKYRLAVVAEEQRKAAETNNGAGAGAGIGGLAGYGDSDDDDVDDVEPDTTAAPSAQAAVIVDPGPSQSPDSDDAVKAARRARAREWAERRRAAQESPVESM